MGLDDIDAAIDDQVKVSQKEVNLQIRKLNDKYKKQLAVAVTLRAEIKKLNNNARLTEEAKKTAEEVLRQERLKGSWTREQLVIEKHKFSEAQDELEILRGRVQSYQEQLEDWNRLAEELTEVQMQQIDQFVVDLLMIKQQMNLANQTMVQLQENVEKYMPLLMELQEDNDKLADKCVKLEKSSEEKNQIITQLNNQLKCVCEERAKKVAGSKYRCERVRKSMQSQNTGLKGQIFQSRAKASRPSAKRAQAKKALMKKAVAKRYKSRSKKPK